MNVLHYKSIRLRYIKIDLKKIRLTMVCINCKYCKYYLSGYSIKITPP